MLYKRVRQIKALGLMCRKAIQGPVKTSAFTYFLFSYSHYYFSPLPRDVSKENNFSQTNNSTVLSFNTHPINMLLEMLSKWPLYLSHGPAALQQQKKTQGQTLNTARQAS